MKADNEVADFYGRKLASREREIDKLRGYIFQIESSGSKGVAEFRKLLDEKDREVEQLIQLLKSEESVNRQLSEQLDSLVSVSPAPAAKRESSDAAAVSRLASQLKIKDSEVEKLRDSLAGQEVVVKELRGRLKLAGPSKSEHGDSKLSGFYAAQISSRDKEIERLRNYVLQLESAEASLSSGFSMRLEEKDAELKSLVSLLKSKESVNRQLSEQLESTISKDREYGMKIRDAILKKDRLSTDALSALKDELRLKDGELSRLRDALVAQERLVQQLGAQTIDSRKRIEVLSAFVDEKDMAIKRLESSFVQQLKNRDLESESLRKELKQQLSKRQGNHAVEELTRLKVQLEARESENSELASRISELREQSAVLRKRLDERQRLFVESESSLNELVRKIQEQHEARLKDVLQKASRREAGLRAELEMLKASTLEKETLVVEKQRKIDDTLMQFAETSKRLLELKGVDGSDLLSVDLRKKEDYLLQKERELKDLLQEAGQKVKDSKEKEAELERRESMLLKEQEALNSELSVLQNAGVEIGRAKDFIKSKIAEYGSASEAVPSLPVSRRSVYEQPSAVAESPAEGQVVESAPVVAEEEKAGVLEILRRGTSVQDAPEVQAMEKPVAPKNIKGVFKEVKSKVKALPKPPLHIIKSKAERPKLREALVRQAEKQDAFPEESGYGEIDEVKSIIDIGLQHGDSIEQIRSSLESSGYSKQNIDKAFQLVKKV
ncbi:hypothetical protein HYU12_03220 [Candidatus Woesearchaeota archaeon]|nr:hypothetical protein [Candidatus Woesearchaeota archaeon]